MEEIHQEIVKVLDWMNKDVPEWLTQIDCFHVVCDNIRKSMG